jgi:hypothetical protein
LQWPHQGAWNLMKAPLPAVSESKLEAVSETAPALALVKAAESRVAAKILDIVTGEGSRAAVQCAVRCVWLIASQCGCLPAVACAGWTKPDTDRPLATAVQLYYYYARSRSHTRTAAVGLGQCTKKVLATAVPPYRYLLVGTYE